MHAHDPIRRRKKVKTWRKRRQKGDITEAALRALEDRLFEDPRRCHHLVHDLETMTHQLAQDHRALRVQGQVSFYACILMLLVAFGLVVLSAAAHVFDHANVPGHFVIGCAIAAKMIAAFPFWFWRECRKRLSNINVQIHLYRRQIMMAGKAAAS